MTLNHNMKLPDLYLSQVGYTVGFACMWHFIYKSWSHSYYSPLLKQSSKDFFFFFHMAQNVERGCEVDRDPSCDSDQDKTFDLDCTIVFQFPYIHP